MIRQDRSVPTNVTGLIQAEPAGHTAVLFVIRRIASIDPTPHKEYTPWLVRCFASGQSRFEDILSRGAQAVARFQKLNIKKQLSPVDRDIGRLKSVQQLEQVLDNYPDVEPQQVNKGKAAEVYKDAQLRIIVPADQVAACYYGQGTKWCTAANTNNMFNSYNEKGKLFIIVPTAPQHAGEKFQFHFETKSFMDEKDDAIDIVEFANRYPQIRTIFAQQIDKNNIAALLFTPQQLAEIGKTAPLQRLITGIVNKLHTLSPGLLKEAGISPNSPAGKKFGFLLHGSEIAVGVATTVAKEIVRNFAEYASATADNYGLIAEIQSAMADQLLPAIEKLLEHVVDDVDTIGMDMYYDISGSLEQFSNDTLIPVIIAEAKKKYGVE